MYKNYYSYFDGRRIISSLFADGLFCIATRADEYEYENIEKLINKVFDEGEYDEILDTIEFIAENIKIKIQKMTITETFLHEIAIVTFVRNIIVYLKKNILVIDL